MAEQTDSQLRSTAQTIRDETEVGANSATRIGGLFENIVDSKVHNPSTGLTFSPLTGVKLNNTIGTIYNLHTQSGPLNIEIDDSDASITGFCELPIAVDSGGITVSLMSDSSDVTDSNRYVKSDEPSTDPGTTDMYVFWRDALGIWYTIINYGTI